MKQLIIETTRRICDSEARIKYYDDLLSNDKNSDFIESIKLAREISVISLESYQKTLDMIKE